MKKLSALFMFVFCFFVGNLRAQTTVVNGNEAFKGSVTSPSINSVLYVDGIIHTNLASAYAACTGNCIIYDAVPETFTSNPFSTCKSVGYSSVIYLAANMGTEVPIIITCSGLVIKGNGGSGSGGFYAAASFCSGAYIAATGCVADAYPVVEIGSTAVPQFTFSTRLEDMVINCEAILNCTPFLGSGLAEQSGARNVTVVNFLANGFSLTTAYTTNFEMEQLVAEPAASATIAVGLKINGVDMDNNRIGQLTVLPFVGGLAAECVDIENSSVALVEIHCEGATYGVLANNSRYTIIGYHTGQGTAATAPTDHIRITGTSVGTVIDENADNPAYGTNMIHNTTTGTTITVASTSGKLLSYWNGQNSSSDGECYVYFGGGGTTCTGTFTGGAIQSSTTVLMNGSGSGHTTLSAPATGGAADSFPAAAGTVSLDQIEYCGATSGATQACAKTVKTNPIIVFGDAQLNTATTQAITTLPFTAAADYSCSGSDLSTPAGIVSFPTYTSGAQATIQETGGANTDHLRYMCVGF